ncbi:tetraacyldisaccharide 4'-kinase [Roseibium aggregatum]|uniref:Tetraacyldisaccharide 4'-kinase n=1 Tax=Roseibium aggregatum TaxID=187304 RepID=A0A926NYR3_9HYPH|nr:tetraacyldisaccharide 4'-kinase [Roseibium aggregatum]MBD1546080.1 tetraacyldisaccharide 4'-kinase [Roseibium aggregatum]
MKQAPDFWWRRGFSWQALVLALPSLVYGRIAGRRMLQEPRGRASVPVVCIGNFVVGGTGKTPFSLRLAERLKSEGYKPAFLLRGYGGSAEGPLVVDAFEHDAETVGDEALLLARQAPTVIAADRVAGADLIQDLDADIILMDDGFQNPALHKDLSIVLVDAETGLGNGRCLPAGPLRAPLSMQILKTDVLVVVGEGDAARQAVHLASRKGLPICTATVEAEDTELLRECSLLAYAGIGRPQKFFATLEKLGLDVAETRAFGDHHGFTEKEAETLLTRAEAGGLQLVTTSKDMARLKTARHEIFRWLAARSAVLNVTMKIIGEDRLIGLIREIRRSRTFRR